MAIHDRSMISSLQIWKTWIHEWLQEYNFLTAWKKNINESI